MRSKIYRRRELLDDQDTAQGMSTSFSGRDNPSEKEVGSMSRDFAIVEELGIVVASGTLRVARENPPAWIWDHQSNPRCDVTVDIITSFVSVGGVIRSSEGIWLTGFHKSIGIVTPIQVELWAIYIGLHVAWSHGFELLQVQSDNFQIIRFLSDNKMDCVSLPLVRAILSLSRRSW
ncbi:uncharacterized protein LOC120177842 [Hibiscus syriacus]|uniref:uncharacterized protein LOC120177842 n=1 Tax=Hibiscus syriacus TaxID=106335 RepID=UPI00192492CD|nr:uncharacterized protein LOC120177842 [Hibiscus syriacus]